MKIGPMKRKKILRFIDPIFMNTLKLLQKWFEEQRGIYGTGRKIKNKYMKTEGIGINLSKIGY